MMSPSWTAGIAAALQAARRTTATETNAALRTRFMSRKLAIGESSPDPFHGPESEARQPPGAEGDLHGDDRHGNRHRGRRADAPPQPEPEPVRQDDADQRMHQVVRQ